VNVTLLLLHEIKPDFISLLVYRIIINKKEDFNKSIPNILKAGIIEK
jgi:hypothetical protein